MALENYASIIGAGMNLVPDLRAQAMQDQQFKMQREVFEARKQAAAEEQRQATEGRAALEQALLSGKPQDLLKIMAMYPAISEQVKPIWQAMDEQQRRTTLTQAGTIYARAQAGDYKGAAGALRARVDADRAAGQADPEDEAILAGLESDDPVQQRAAGQMIGVQIAALDPDKFAETYGKLNPTEATPAVQREYQWRVGQFGQQAADRWLATKDTDLVTVEPGGSVFNKSDFVTPTGGGDPASSGGGGLVATPQQEAQSADFARAFGMEGVTVDDRTGTVYNPDGSVRTTLGGGVVMPVEGGSFGQTAQQFGAPRDGGSRSHNGLDISGVLGAPIKALKPGKVVAVGSDPRSGNFVRVKHADGSISSYAHLGSQSVSVGQDVAAGFSLGTLGRSGNAEAGEGRGVLHLVVRDAKGRAIDPRPMLGVPVRVRTRQEYERLASGTAYIAPDGSHRVKP